MTLNIGDKAPNFNLPATGGKKIDLSSLSGKKTILYFYPKDDTSGCTAQACDFRDSFSQFRGASATVLGISKDSIKSHDKFRKKYNLPFDLLSDEDGNVCETYGVWVQKSMYGRDYMGIERSTFLIDEKGIIRGIWRKVSVPGHVVEVQATLGGGKSAPVKSAVKPKARIKSKLKLVATKKTLKKKTAKKKTKPAAKSQTKTKIKKVKASRKRA